jgi:hypothetical protein
VEEGGIAYEEEITAFFRGSADDALADLAFRPKSNVAVPPRQG